MNIPAGPEPINPADYRFFLITGSIQLAQGDVLPIFTGAHARTDDLPDGEEGRTEIAARLLRQVARQARGEDEAGPEGEATDGEAPGGTWRKVFVLELPRPAEAVIND